MKDREYKKLSELKLGSFSGETSDLGNAEAKASVFQEVSYEKIPDEIMDTLLDKSIEKYGEVY